MFELPEQIIFHPVVIFPSVNPAMYFLGAANDDGSLFSRESGDFPTYEAAAAALGSTP